MAAWVFRTSSQFQSTLSLRRATASFLSVSSSSLHFNPRSPCGERPKSILPTDVPRDFNPRSPCGERHGVHGGNGHSSRDFNPRSPCGERHALGQVNGVPMQISIHALLAESDKHALDILPSSLGFQSTLSLRRATMRSFPRGTNGLISIHALLAESDTFFVRRLRGASDFNPRSPCGERQQIPPNWPYRFCLKCQFKDGEKSKKAKGSASAQASSPAYEKNKVRIPWGDFECFRFAPIK